MEKKLTIIERLLLLTIIPNQGNITQLEIIRVLREMLSFNESENRVLNFVEDPATGSTRWDNKGAEMVGAPTFEIGRIQLKIIEKAMRGALKNMSQQEALTQGHLDLGKRFITDYDAFIVEIKAGEEKAEVIQFEKDAEAKRQKKKADKK